MTAQVNSTVRSILSVVASALHGIVVATGMLAIGIAVTALLKGYSMGDFWVETFPRFRGPSGVLRIPAIAYAVFFLYVISAAEVAILSRRAIARRLGSGARERPST